MTPLEIQGTLNTYWDPSSATFVSGFLRNLIPRPLEEDRDPRFQLKFFVPLDRPVFARLTSTLNTIEKRVRLAILLAFLKPHQIERFTSIDELLHAFPEVTVDVYSISIGSVEVTIKGDPEEISKLLTNEQRPRPWKLKLTVGLAVVFGAAALLLASVNESDEPIIAMFDRIRKEAAEACQTLPDGIKATLNFGILEIEIPCTDKGGQG